MTSPLYSEDNAIPESDDGVNSQKTGDGLLLRLFKVSVGRSVHVRARFLMGITTCTTSNTARSQAFILIW